VINNAEEDIAEQENNLAIVENTYGEQSPWLFRIQIYDFLNPASTILYAYAAYTLE
jgi:hypothetical protein